WGMLTSDVRHDVVQTRVGRADRLRAAALEEIWRGLEARLFATFAEEGLDAGQVTLARSTDMRYAGQEHTVNVPIAAGAAIEETVADFHELHEIRYTFRLNTAAEFVNFRVSGFGAVRKPEPSRLARSADATAALKGTREVDFDILGRHDASLYE